LQKTKSYLKLATSPSEIGEELHPTFSTLKKFHGQLDKDIVEVPANNSAFGSRAESPQVVLEVSFREDTASQNISPQHVTKKLSRKIPISAIKFAQSKAIKSTNIDEMMHN
jgi:hypothetical protein